VAFEQLHAQRLFEIADAFRKGRLGDVQPLRRLAKAGTADDFLKMAKLPQLHDPVSPQVQDASVMNIPHEGKE
jgi:hypothetical protein